MLENETNLSNQSRSEQRSPISLSLLFYLVTVAAIMAACIRFIQSDNSITANQVVAACVLCAFTGMSLGFSMWIRGMLKYWTAPLLGLALGAAAGPILCVRLTHFSELIVMSFLGSWLLIVLICITARWSTKKVQHSDTSL